VLQQGADGVPDVAQVFAQLGSDLAGEGEAGRRLRHGEPVATAVGVDRKSRRSWGLR
jgi:hypothetical protein